MSNMSDQRKAMCIWCGHEALYTQGDEMGQARAWKELVNHDGVCPKNPTALERDRYREAIKAYRSEIENPEKDQTMIRLRRQQLFALLGE